MLIVKITGCVAAAAIASFISISATRAAISPVVHQTGPIYKNIDCAVGFHIGAAGACIIGTDDGPAVPPPAAVVDAPSTDCQTETVNKTDSAGNSVTKTRTNCPQ
jgi:hypothetical protein